MVANLSRLRVVRPASAMAVVVGACLLAAPALAAQTRSKVKVDTDAARARVASLVPPSIDTSRFAFTAPGRAAPQRLATIERSFRFTPSGSPDRKALALGVTSRVIAPTATAAAGPATARAAAPSTEVALAPAGYNFDLSVDWKGFAVSGGISRVDQGLGFGRRDGVDVGLGYRASRWRAGLQATAERGLSAPLDPVRLSMAQLEPRYSFEASGAYALSPGVSVNGGVRYRMNPVNPQQMPDDRAVFVGGSLAF